MQEESLYIRALQFGSGRGWFSFNDMLIGISVDKGSRAAEILQHQIEYRQLFSHKNEQQRVVREGNSTSPNLHMTVEDEFRLLEHTELQEARASSRSATLFAAWALGISILSTLASIGFSVFEILIQS